MGAGGTVSGAGAREAGACSRQQLFPPQPQHLQVAALAPVTGAKSVASPLCASISINPSKMTKNRFKRKPAYFFLVSASFSFLRNFSGFLLKSFRQDLQQSLISWPL